MEICNFANDIVNLASSLGNKIAIRDGVADVTYADLAQRIPRMASTLQQLGLQPGQTVIIQMEDCVDWPVAFLGCVYIGAVPLPISTVAGTELFWNLAKFTDCRLIIAGTAAAKRLVDCAGAPDIPILPRNQFKHIFNRSNPLCLPYLSHPDAPAYMGISSGSTGMPKVAVHRQRVFKEILNTVPKLAYDMNQHSVIMSIAKMSWGYGLHNSVTYALGLGATAIVVPELPVTSVLFDFMNRYQPDIVVSSPSIIKKLLVPSAAKYSMPPSVKHFHSSGEDLPAPMYNAFLERFGIKLSTSIGMLETCQTYAATTSMDHAPGTVGKPLPGVEVKVVGSDSQLCQPGQVGEFYVNSPANACYYLKNYAKTQDTFVGKWVRTGDCGYWDNNGNLVFTGRVDDVFKVNDLIVSPVAIESEIISNPYVEQVIATGIPDVQGKKELHAFVVPADKFDLDRFNTFLSQRLFPHQIPKKIHIVETLPETMTNKKDRKVVQNVN